MGTFDRICWLGLGLTIGIYMGMQDGCFDNKRYKLIKKNDGTYIRDAHTGATRELYDGLKLGTVEERVQDIFEASEHEYPNIKAAVQKNARRRRYD